MDITITSANTDDYLLINSAGVIKNKDDLFKHATLVYDEFVKQDKQKILIDNRKTLLPPDLFSYYEQVKYFSETFPSRIRLVKIAVVVSPEYAEIGKFWETVCVNRGFQYFVFTSLQEAHRWLLK